MKEFMQWMVVGVVFCLMIWGIYWVGKTVSYSLFYEDTVIATIKDTVKAASLK